MIRLPKGTWVLFQVGFLVFLVGFRMMIHVDFWAD